MISIKKDKIMDILIYILLLLCFIGQYINNSLISIISTLSIILLTIRYPIDKYIILLYTILPFFNILNKKIGTTSLYYIFIIIYIIKYMIYNKRYKILTKILIIVLIILFTLYTLFSLIYIKWLLLIIPLILSYKEKFLIENFKILIKKYTISMIFSSLLGLYMYYNGTYIYNTSYVWTESKTYIRFSGLYGDSNIYAQSLLVIISLLICEIIKDKNKKYYIYIILLILFGIITYSKMNILLLLYLLVLLFIYKIKNKLKKRNKIKLVIIILSLIIVLFIFLKNMNSNIIYSYIVRFSKKDILSGRMEIYKHLINLLKEHPIYLLIGMGFENYTQLITLKSGQIVKYAHNIYLECICLYGIIITFIILKKLFNIIKNNIKNISILPLIILLTTGLTLHGNLEFAYFFNLSLALNYIYLNKEKY